MPAILHEMYASHILISAEADESLRFYHFTWLLVFQRSARNRYTAAHVSGITPFTVNVSFIVSAIPHERMASVHAITLVFRLSPSLYRCSRPNR